MTNGWTGGQYSLYRAVFGIYLAVQFLGLLPRESFSSALITIGVVAALFLIAGLYDRAAALSACVGLACLHLRDVIPGSLSVAFVLWLLVAHALLPTAPYGSWAARGRVDPAGGWRMPAAVRAASVVVMLVGCGWLVLTWMRAGRATVADFRDLFPGMAFLVVFAFNPKWVPPRWSHRRDRIFYDGTCALCHGLTRFVLSEDRLETSFTFAALQGPGCATAIAPADCSSLPDSMVVKTDEGVLLTRSDAAIYILERLGGAWRVIAAVLRAVPKGLRDLAYDIVARVRYRVFGRAESVCPVVPANLRSRFHDR